jgi:hypothetical protein
LDGRFGVSKHAYTSCHIQPLRQRRQHFGYSLSWCLQPVEGCLSSHRELGFARLAEEILDTLVLAVASVAYQGVDTGIGDVGIITSLGGTRISLCVDPLLSPPWALDLTPRYDLSLEGFLALLICFSSALSTVIGRSGA